MTGAWTLTAVPSNASVKIVSDRGSQLPHLRASKGRTADLGRQGRFHHRAFRYEIDENARRDAEVVDGTLLLVTNTASVACDDDIAPVHHRLPERIRAHALICFLALVMHRVLQSRRRASGGALSPSRALAVLWQVQQLHVTINHQPAMRFLSQCSFASQVIQDFVGG